MVRPKEARKRSALVARTLTLFFELCHVGRRQLPPLSLFDRLAQLLHLGRARAIRAGVPARLQRSGAARAAAAQPPAAVRAGEEVDRDCGAAPRTHLADLA